MMYSYLGAFLLAVASSLILTMSVRGLATRHGWVFRPNSSRHLHTKPIPRLGGVSIYLSFAGVLVVSMAITRYFGFAGGFQVLQVIGVMGPATIVFLLGLYDDLYSVSAYLKFAVQTIAAALLYLNGFGISRLTILPGGRPLGHLLGFALTVLWVVLITNAFNLIDGLDGLAAGSALFSTLVVFVSLFINERAFFTFLAVVLAGAIAGFLRYNFNPATIFLGDSGSLFIGFLLSAMALAGSQKSSTMIAVAIPVVSLGLPILDVIVAVIRRFLNSKPLFGSDQEHIHHRLMKRGFSHRQAVVILYGVSAFFGLVSLFLIRGGESAFGVTLVVLGFAVFMGLQQLRYHEVFELQRVVDRAMNQKQIIASNLRIRKAAETLGNCQTLAEIYAVLTDALESSGFDGLTIRLKTDLRSSHEHSEALDSLYNGGSRLFWLPKSGDFEPVWSLSLGLCDSNCEVVGSFSIHRVSLDNPLRMDINVFSSSGFSTALAEAVQRVARPMKSYADDSRIQLIGNGYPMLPLRKPAFSASTGK